MECHFFRTSRCSGTTTGGTRRVCITITWGHGQCFALLRGRQGPLLSLTLVSLRVTSLQWRGRFPISSVVSSLLGDTEVWMCHVGVCRTSLWQKWEALLPCSPLHLTGKKEKKYIRGAGGWYLPNSGWWSSHTVWIIYSICQKGFFLAQDHCNGHSTEIHLVFSLKISFAWCGNTSDNSVLPKEGTSIVASSQGKEPARLGFLKEQDCFHKTFRSLMPLRYISLTKLTR